MAPDAAATSRSSSARSQVPHAHEFFCPMGALTAERGYEAPAMRAMMTRLTSAANFFGTPEAQTD